MDLFISPIAQPHDETLRDTPDQVLPIKTVTVHITGRQTYLNAEKKKVPPLIHLGEYFDGVGNPFAHYSVDPWGRVACHADEGQTPYAQGWGHHNGLNGIRRSLVAGRLEVPDWWKTAWCTTPSLRRPRALCEDPTDLLPEGTKSPNERSAAIEFIQYGGQLRLTLAQYAIGNHLLADICLRHGVPMRLGYVRGHEDVDPWGRGTSRGGWDPGGHRKHPTFSWTALMDPTTIEFKSSGEPKDFNIIPTPPLPDWAK